jgi:hypothetical protein
VKLERVKIAGLQSLVPYHSSLIPSMFNLEYGRFLCPNFLSLLLLLLYLKNLPIYVMPFVTFIFRVRTSSGTFLARGRDKIIRNIEKKIADFTFLPAGMWFKNPMFLYVLLIKMEVSVSYVSLCFVDQNGSFCFIFL